MKRATLVGVAGSLPRVGPVLAHRAKRRRDEGWPLCSYLRTKERQSWHMQFPLPLKMPLVVAYYASSHSILSCGRRMIASMGSDAPWESSALRHLASPLSSEPV